MQTARERTADYLIRAGRPWKVVESPKGCWPRWKEPPPRPLLCILGLYRKDGIRRGGSVISQAEGTVIVGVSTADRILMGCGCVSQM